LPVSWQLNNVSLRSRSSIASRHVPSSSYASFFLSRLVYIACSPSPACAMLTWT
jgi:hypothetical protein